MSQAILSTTTIPRPVSVGTIYLPEIHYPRINAREYYGLPTDACGMADVVKLIVDGQIEHPVRVLAMNVGASECWDASAQIAATVLVKALDKYDAIPQHCEAFLETHLGIHNVREAEYEHRLGGAHERSRAA